MILFHRRVGIWPRGRRSHNPNDCLHRRRHDYPMGRITRDYLCAHRLCPQQCAPNFFRVLGAIDFLDRHLGLGLTWYDVAHLYEGHQEAQAGFYLKSRSNAVKLISCLPKSNKGMKDDFLIVFRPLAWWPSLPNQARRASWNALTKLVVLYHHWFMPYKVERGRNSFQCGTTKCLRLRRSSPWPWSKNCPHKSNYYYYLKINAISHIKILT